MGVSSADELRLLTRALALANGRPKREGFGYLLIASSLKLDLEALILGRMIDGQICIPTSQDVLASEVFSLIKFLHLCP